MIQPLPINHNLLPTTWQYPGDTSGYLFFVFAAIVYCAALLPTAISAGAAPAALVSVSLDLPGLWRNSPVAVFSVFMVGISNAAFGTLAAVYASRVGLDVSGIALFASIPVLAGAVAQIPVGALSDRFDRRLVLIGVAVIALVADGLFVLFAPTEQSALLLLAAVFGATVFSMYPVIVAHASDHAKPGTFIQVSGGLLLVYGVGSIVGPTIAGFAMTSIGTSSLFVTSGSAHILLLLFALFRLRTAPPVAEEDKVAFQPAPLPRAATPETANLASEESVVAEENREH